MKLSQNADIAIPSFPLQPSYLMPVCTETYLLADSP